MTMRLAKIGDQGTLVGLQSHGSIAALVLQTNDHEQASLYGDWRVIRDLAEAFQGQRIEVVAGEGSTYGVHGILPI